MSISFFNENGYLILEKIFSEDECNEIVKQAETYNLKDNYIPIMNLHKFSNKIPLSYKWYSLNKNKEFIPSFTKKIFQQVSVLF